MNLELTPINVGITADSAASQKPTKLDQAAKQFESLMIEQMMKSVRSDGGWLSDGDETGEDNSMSMAEQQFAQSLANNGGLGLAKMIVKTMSRSSETNQSSVPASAK